MDARRHFRLEGQLGAKKFHPELVEEVEEKTEYELEYEYDYDLGTRRSIEGRGSREGALDVSSIHPFLRCSDDRSHPRTRRRSRDELRPLR
jgi:hypothetical protein